MNIHELREHVRGLGGPGSGPRKGGGSNADLSTSQGRHSYGSDGIKKAFKVRSNFVSAPVAAKSDAEDIKSGVISGLFDKGFDQTSSETFEKNRLTISVGLEQVDVTGRLSIQPKESDRWRVQVQGIPR